MKVKSFISFDENEQQIYMSFWKLMDDLIHYLDSINESDLAVEISGSFSSLRCAFDKIVEEW